MLLLTKMTNITNIPKSLREEEEMFNDGILSIEDMRKSYNKSGLFDSNEIEVWYLSVRKEQLRNSPKSDESYYEEHKPLNTSKFLSYVQNGFITLSTTEDDIREMSWDGHTNEILVMFQDWKINNLKKSQK